MKQPLPLLFILIALLAGSAATSFADTMPQAEDLPEDTQRNPYMRSIEFLFKSHETSPDTIRVSMKDLKIRVESDSIMLTCPTGRMQMGLADIKGWTHSHIKGIALTEMQPGVPNRIDTTIPESAMDIILHGGMLTVRNIKSAAEVRLVTLNGVTLPGNPEEDGKTISFPVSDLSGVAILRLHDRCIKLILPQR